MDTNYLNKNLDIKDSYDLSNLDSNSVQKLKEHFHHPSQIQSAFMEQVELGKKRFFISSQI